MRIQDILATLCVCVGLSISQGLLAEHHSEATKAGEMGTQATRALVEKFNDAWINSDAAKMAPLVSDDVVWGLPVSVRHHTLKGRDEVVAYFTGGSGSAKRDTIARTRQKLVVEGDTAVWFHHYTVELEGGGTYSNDYAWRYTCADGKVTRIDEYVDMLHAYEQIPEHPFLRGVLDN